VAAVAAARRCEGPTHSSSSTRQKTSQRQKTASCHCAATRATRGGTAWWASLLQQIGSARNSRAEMCFCALHQDSTCCTLCILARVAPHLCHSLFSPPPTVQDNGLQPSHKRGHLCARVCLRVCAFACLRVCAFARLRARTFACLCVCMLRARTFACLRSRVPCRCSPHAFCVCVVGTAVTALARTFSKRFICEKSHVAQPLCSWGAAAVVFASEASLTRTVLPSSTSTLEPPLSWPTCGTSRTRTLTGQRSACWR
jgi:hypothetical protein